MRKMGGLGSMLKSLPGGTTHSTILHVHVCLCFTLLISLSLTGIGLARGLQEEQIYEMEQKFKRYEIIVGAMTVEERAQPDLIAAQVLLSSFHSYSYTQFS